MEITKSRLKTLIKEELQRFLSENLMPEDFDEDQQAAWIALSSLQPEKREAVLDALDESAPAG